jgi:hypothetical protein
MLFRARYYISNDLIPIYRPPLEYVKPLPKGKCKQLRGLLDGQRDYYAMFEDTEPPKKVEIEKP